MDRHRDFATDLEGEPITFTLEGERFVLHPVIPASATLAYGAAVGRTTGAIDFIEKCMTTDEDRKRYRALLDDPTKIIGADTMVEIFVWLTEVYTARPTQPPESSSAGRQATGVSSTVASPSPVPVPLV